MDRTERWEKLMRDSIVDGVIEVLTEHGSDGLTMNRVAKRADVSKGTLYTYFDDKAELIESTIQTALGPIRQELEAILTGPGDPDELLRSFVDRQLAFFEDNRDVFRVLLYERHNVLGEWTRYETSRYHELIDTIGEVVADGIEGGFFRELDPTQVAAMLVEANISVIHRRLFGGQCNSTEKDRDMILEIFLHGIRSHSKQRAAQDSG